MDCGRWRTDRRWLLAAWWSIACAFESGGVSGSGSGATIGSAGSAEGTSTTDPVDDSTAGPGSTANPNTTATTTGDPTTPTTDDMPDDDVTTAPVGEETGVDPTTGDPLESTTTTARGDDDDDDGGSSSEGGGGPPPHYGDCMGDVDCAGVEGACYQTDTIDGTEIAVCTLPCGEGCPDPTSGTATPLCTNSQGCALDCMGGLVCPDGMTCYSFDAGSYFRCLWAHAE